MSLLYSGGKYQFSAKGDRRTSMTKINKIVNNDKKADVNMFIRGFIAPIGNIHFDREVSLNELIASYVKKSTLCKLDEGTDDLGNAYLSVAILLAFVERISTPIKKPSSIDEILDTGYFATEDMIAECVGIIAKSIFEDDSERADEYFNYLAVLTKESLEEDGFDFSDNCSEPDEPDTMSESDNEIVPKDWATPV